MSAAVRVNGLRVTRRGRLALRDVSIAVEPGTVTGLIGPSGGGKSTLMRALVGVQRVDGGEVEVLGLPAGSPALRRRVGYMTQELSVYRDLTVRENLRYFARVLGVDGGRVDAVLRDVDLADVEGHRVDRLSGGQQARVSLATALIGEPDLLVLDEPTVGLDPLLRDRLWHMFGELARAGRTLIVSSHVMDEASRCDRLLLLRDGGVLAAGEPQELLAQTGARDLEHAFIQMVEREGRA